MSRSFVWMVLLVSMGLSACAHHQGTSRPETPNRVKTRPAPPQLCHTLEVEDPIDTTAACPRWRWIGVMSDSEDSCPKLAPGRTAGNPQALFGSQPLPQALRPFCVYEFPERGDALELAVEGLEDLVRQGRLQRVDSGCMALSPAASGSEPQNPDLPQLAAQGLSSLTFTDLQEHLFAQVGRIELPTDSTPGVRLAFLDTQPTHGSVSMDRGRSDHGYALAQMARQFACNGNCTAEITTRLALPIYDFDREDSTNTLRDSETGGYFGSIDDLARGLRDEVEAWQRSYAPHLVLNLSVAWDGELFGGLERRVSRMPAGVQAVYRALEVAACHGALVIAAAGNRRGGPDEDLGPLLPAAWEDRDAPDAAACAAALSEEPPTLRLISTSSGGAQPLIYAVGGVTSNGAPLVNARPEGTPPRVAYGDHAVVEDHRGSPTATLTGTSVSTAVVSTTAAVVWHYRPELGRHELMEILETSGDDLGRSADFYHPSRSTVPGVRRISLCTALQRACALGKGSCPYSLPECPPWTQDPPTLSLDAFQGEESVASTLTEDLGPNSFCRASRFLYDSRFGIPTKPCPYQQFYGIRSRPWTGPQPQVIPCPSCTIQADGEGTNSVNIGNSESSLIGVSSESSPLASVASTSYTLNLEIRDDWPADLPLTDVSLVIDTTGYTMMQALKEVVLERGDSVRLRIELNGPNLSPSTPIVLYFNTKEGSIENPVLLVQ